MIDSTPSLATRLNLACAALLLPLTLFAGKLVEYILKSTNPEHTDIHGVLAYLTPILVTSMVVFGIILVTGVVSGLFALKSNKKLALLTLLLLALELILAIGILWLQSATGALR